MAAQYEAEIAEESEGQSYELMGSQVRRVQEMKIKA